MEVEFIPLGEALYRVTAEDLFNPQRKRNGSG